MELEDAARHKNGEVNFATKSWAILGCLASPLG